MAREGIRRSRPRRAARTKPYVIFLTEAKRCHFELVVMPRAQKRSKTGAKPKPQEETVQQRQKHVSLSTYISMVGVHTTLLGYAGLFLPRTTVLQQLALYEVDAAVLSSQDRPQPSFFNALTRSPTVTLFALCLGALILQTWWSSWLRVCSIDISSHRSEEDKLKEKYLPTGQKAKVRRSLIHLTTPVDSSMRL